MLALLALALGTAGDTHATSARLRIGDAVPDLTVPTTHGGPVRLGALRGRVLILNFFASYCGPCRTELPLLRELSTRLSAAARARAGSPELVLLPVGVDERPADSARFAADLGLTTPVLLDADGAVRAAFTPERYPCTFVVDAAGVVRHINRGFGPGYPARMERWLRALLALPVPS
jgi:peroxiredoxin